MLHVIESGETAWAVGASEGRLVVFQRDDEGWIELDTREGDELDSQASGLLDALYEGHHGNGNGAAASTPEPSSRKDDEEDPDENPDEDEDEEDEEDEEPQSRRRKSSSSSTRSRQKARR